MFMFSEHLHDVFFLSCFATQKLCQKVGHVPHGTDPDHPDPKSTYHVSLLEVAELHWTMSELAHAPAGEVWLRRLGRTEDSPRNLVRSHDW